MCSDRRNDLCKDLEVCRIVCMRSYCSFLAFEEETGEIYSEIVLQACI
jgi:hypothetical protein